VSKHGPQESSRGARRPLAVLIIEPDREYAQRLASALDRSDTVAVAGSARAAYTAMRARIPDIVVTELDLPDAQGIDLITTVHSTPATRHVLLLVITTRASVRDKIAAFQAGADDYLVKPVGGQQLGEHVGLLSRFQQVIGRVGRT
jgi:DNA-binding response OmpR family regulator